MSLSHSDEQYLRSLKEDLVKQPPAACPVCNSDRTWWQLSGTLCCKECGLIYPSITSETINDPAAILEARKLLYRRLRNPKGFSPRTEEQIARDKRVNAYVGETDEDIARNKNRPCPICGNVNILYEPPQPCYIDSTSPTNPNATYQCSECGWTSLEDEQAFIQTLASGSCVEVRQKGENIMEKIGKSIEEGLRERIESAEEIDSMLYARHALKDSGARREFETGAVRDISEGKGRCDLLPLDVVGKLLNSEILECIEMFKETKDVTALFTAIIFFSRNIYGGVESCMLEVSKHFEAEVSKHFEAGALKYGENNWKKGIPLHCYLDSAVRHYLKHLRGDTDEPHDRAFVWNLLCAIWTFTHKPELDDVERYLVKLRRKSHENITR